MLTRYTWLVFSALLLALLVAAGTFLSPAPTAQAAPLFRIIDVREHDGQLLVEVEHFKADGSFDYFENYLWQGRQGLQRPRVVNAQGGLYLDDGSLAPFNTDAFGKRQFYRPDARTWLRYNTPHMDAGSILSVVGAIHSRRLLTGWTRGQSRLIEPPRIANQRDREGVGILVSKFQGLLGTAYATGTPGTLSAYAGDLPPINPGLGFIEYGTVSTFYPDAHIETSSVDGHLLRDGIDEPLGTIRAGAGVSFTDSAATENLVLRGSSTPDQYDFLARGIIVYDSSALPDGDEITAATLGFVVVGKTDTFTDSMGLIVSTPNSDIALEAADYAQTGGGSPTRLAADLTVASITSDSSTFNEFTLNASGLANISKIATSKFAFRLASELDNSNTWSSGGTEQVLWAAAEEVLSGDKRPRLVVTHAAPAESAAVTGTIGDGATEQEVREGAGTIIITLTAATWDDPITSERQNIIDGLDAAESETNGWNAQVRDAIGVGSVARTSDTIVTITLAQAEVAGYRIDSNETVTVTVPASAYSGSGALTATPTIALTAAAESLSVSGSILNTTRPVDIVAGGRVIVLGLTNTVWVDAGATFNAQRQTIINNLVADLADQNGWNNRRVDFAVGDVARTSSTVVTITLSASSAYAIPATETISATVPASALVFAEALTPTATIPIVPTFALIGNRVSTAIDLSSITDVASCAIGWESTTPTGTTLTVDTSVDGGSAFSSATNGSCPTGITVGGSLAAITDFRVRVNMTTSVSGSSPFLDALGLVIDDTTGADLRYQLNTIPSATIDDRTGGGHTGTMSFPVVPSGVSSTTASMESTRAQVTGQQALVAPQVAWEVSGAATSANLFNLDETGPVGIPGRQAIVAISEAGPGLPIRFVWLMFLGVIIIGMGFTTIILTKNLFYSALVMAAGFGLMIAIGDGLVPGWTIFIYAPMAGVLVWLRKGLPL